MAFEQLMAESLKKKDKKEEKKEEKKEKHHHSKDKANTSTQPHSGIDPES